MPNVAVKFDEGTIDNSKEFPLFALMTRVLIQSLCPILKSELMFGNIERIDSGEKFSYWIDARVSGDLTGSFGVGADNHTLKTLALHLKIKSPDGRPGEKEALTYIHEALALGLEEQCKREDYQCNLSKGSGIRTDYVFEEPQYSYYFCPVETKCGVIKVYFSFRPTSHELVEELSGKAAPLEARKIRVYASQLEALYGDVKNLENYEANLLTGPQVRSQMRKQIKKVKRMLHQLKSESLETLFLPAKKLASDVAKQQGKQVKFATYGTWMCLDKTLLNYLYEPVLHLIRNAVDHGVEDPTERERLGKAATGNVRVLAAFNEKGIRIIVSDDGRGLDIPKIRERAVAKGLLSQDQANRAPNEELHTLIFKAGFSTRERADAISGRGLGLDIVKKGIESVDGNIRVLSTSHHGTSFEITIPLTDDFQTRKVISIDFQPQTKEAEERALLLDEMTGYFERLDRALSVMEKERGIVSAYEAYRLAHSIKGAAGFLGWNRVASFSHNFEELLKLIAEEKTPLDDGIVKIIVDSGKRLREFCDASKTESSYSLFQVRQLEARMLQTIWSATKSDERTHLFLGKYHLNAVEKTLAHSIGLDKKFLARPEADFSKALKQPFGTLVQFSGDRRGYAGILLPEETFKKMINPMITGGKDNESLKKQIWSLTEFANLMGQAISEFAGRASLNLQASPPITYYGWGQPLRILGNPTYCYSCEFDGSPFYLTGDFRMPQEMAENLPPSEPNFEPGLVMEEAVKQCTKHFSSFGLKTEWAEQPTQSDLIGFDGGITAIISCVSPVPGGADSVLFLSYEPGLAQFIHEGFASEGKGKLGVDMYDCLNETSNIVGGLLIAELEKKKLELKLSLPTVFLGKAYVANFNRLFVTNKMVGTTPKGKFELQILVTTLAE